MDFSRPKPKIHSHLLFSVNDTLLYVTHECKLFRTKIKLKKNESKNAIENKFEKSSTAWISLIYVITISDFKLLCFYQNNK